MDLDLTGKNALVGGASQGIGKAIAEELASLGANVTIIARSEDKLKAICESLNAKLLGKHDYLALDYGDSDMLFLKVAAHIKREKKQYHILVNNTGGPAPGPISEAQPEAFLDGFKNHLVCNQVLAQLTLPAMKEAGYGRIVNIISTSVKMPIDGLGVSNTIRGAVASWAKTMANELGQFGITVNNVLPGFTETDRLKSLLTKRAEKAGKSYDEIVKNLKTTIPARRFGGPDEVANAVAFLASPAAAYVNGINLPVDGGRLGCL